MDASFNQSITSASNIAVNPEPSFAQETDTVTTPCSSLGKACWVYIWVDGIYSGLRSEQVKLCALVIIGVNERSEKHFPVIKDGDWESAQSWHEVLLKLKSRGMNMAIGDGAMGFSGRALEEIYPETRQ